MNDIKYNKSTGIIIQDNKKRVLFLKRKTNGLWTIPGGKVDKGETFIESAKRELEEETLIKNIDLKLYTCTTSFTNHKHWKEETYIGYVDESIHFGNPEDDKFEIVKFMYLDELPSFDEIEAYDHCIIEMLRGEREPQLTH